MWATAPDRAPALPSRAAARAPSVSVAGPIDAVWIVLAVLHIGQTIVFSGGDRIPGALDGRLTNLVLEHMYHALRGWTSFASPPQFHPEAGTLFYSEAHWGTFLYYAAFRVAGCSVEGAFQAWMLTTALLNAVAAWLLARTLGAPWWARGPLAFAASSNVVLAGKLGHPQLLPLFPVCLSLAALFAWIERRRPVFLAAFLVALAWVHLACVYHGFFFSLVVAFLVPSLVAAHATSLARDARAVRGSSIALVVAAAAVAAGGLAMLYGPYAAFAAARGWTNPLQLLQDYTPTATAWVSSQSMSWLYGNVLDPTHAAVGAYEKRLFPGVVLLASPFVAIAVGIARRKDPDARLLLPCGVTVVCAMAFVTWLGPATSSAYVWVARHVEAVRAFRAPGRMAYVLLPLQACCLTLLVRMAARARRPRLVAAGVLAACTLESIGFTQADFSFEKAEAQRRVQPLLARVTRGSSGDPFAVVLERPRATGIEALHLDAFAAALASRRPCVNGYSGTEPAWLHVFLAEPTAENLDRALLEIKTPARSVEVVTLEHVLDPVREAAPALRLPSRDSGRYRWGDEVDFSGQGTAGEFIVSGIDPAPSPMRWTIGQRAVLRMIVEPSAVDRSLVIEAFPFLAHAIKAQKVDVAVNGQTVGSLLLAQPGRQEHRVTLPAAALRGRTTLDLELGLPRARAPRDLGLGEDRRVIALALSRLRIE